LKVNDLCCLGENEIVSHKDLKQNPQNAGKLKKMSGAWPKFRVFVVKDGMASGLLVERQLSHDMPAEKKYFWLSSGEKLSPTTEILDTCQGFHEVIAGECNRSFMNLLIGFTTYVKQIGNLKVPPSILNKYLVGEKCQRIIDHFFERGDVILKEFFVNAATFKDVVLAKVTGEEKLVGKAEEFRVISPHDVIGKCHYLKPIAHVLKVGWSAPKWFRREGPLAVDLDAGLVYRRSERLTELRKIVLSNPICLLVGHSAAGKTVLVRQLGYELLKEGHLVYWFDGDLEKGFDRDRLVAEINEQRGIIILENVHTEPCKYQRIYYSVNQKPDRHIVFTARSSLKDLERRDDWRLSEVKQVRLDAGEDMGRIVDYFSERTPEVRWPAEVKEAIVNVSGGSLWLLAYTLEGYVEVRGKGKPTDWMKDGVREDLDLLARVDQAFPGVLVMLSPLSRANVLTDESYLMSMGIEPRVLLQLVTRGEIVKRVVDEEYTLYGLAHSTLAEVYWKYGKRYRRLLHLPEYEEFIYDYSISDVPNGLEAVLSTRPEIREKILAQLDCGHLIGLVLSREWSEDTVCQWITKHYGSCQTKGDISEIILRRVASFHRGDTVGGCVLALLRQDPVLAERIWDTINTGWKGDSESLSGRGLYLRYITRCESGRSRASCESLSFEDLKRRLSESKPVQKTTTCAFCVRISSGDACEKCEMVDLGGASVVEVGDSAK
jgi:hypothetical protein